MLDISKLFFFWKYEISFIIIYLVKELNCLTQIKIIWYAKMFCFLSHGNSRGFFVIIPWYTCYKKFVYLHFLGWTYFILFNSIYYIIHNLRNATWNINLFFPGRINCVTKKKLSQENVLQARCIIAYLINVT